MRAISALELELISGGELEHVAIDGGAFATVEIGPPAAEGFSPLDGITIGGFIGGAAGLTSALTGAGGMAAAGELIATAVVVGSGVGLVAAVVGTVAVAAYIHYGPHRSLP